MLIGSTGSGASDGGSLLLCCLIFGWGNTSVFIDFPGNSPVARFKEAIYNHLKLKDSDGLACRIRIWKVSKVSHPIHHSTCRIYLQLDSPIQGNEIDESLKGVSDPTKIKGGTTELCDPLWLSRYFPCPVAEESIHLVVKLPSSGEHQSVVRMPAG